MCDRVRRYHVLFVRSAVEILRKSDRCFQQVLTHLQIFFERGNGVLCFSKLLQASCQSLDCVVLILSLGREKDVVQLQQLKERLRRRIHVPAKSVREKIVWSDQQRKSRPTRRPTVRTISSCCFHRLMYFAVLVVSFGATTHGPAQAFLCVVMTTSRTCRARVW